MSWPSNGCPLELVAGMSDVIPLMTAGSALVVQDMQNQSGRGLRSKTPDNLETNSPLYRAQLTDVPNITATR